MESEDTFEVASAPQVVNVSAHGFWLAVRGKAYFLGFDSFPSFRNATKDQISSVELWDDGHLYWPELEVDLPLESISQPD